MKEVKYEPRAQTKIHPYELRQKITFFLPECWIKGFFEFWTKSDKFKVRTEEKNQI